LIQSPKKRLKEKTKGKTGFSMREVPARTNRIKKILKSKLKDD